MSAIRREALLAWYDANKRDLPWRRSRDPYAVWVSEIMLQQTQVATVIPYYERWMRRFPTVQALAVAAEPDVLSVWQGLGYYRRCRMLLQGAKWAVEHGIPQSAAEWIKAPGVGRYTASAIASISQGEPVAVVDGNVERVFARYAGCDFAGPPLTRAAWAWAERQVPPDRPGDWNQAMMELGATVCKPREPLCGACPLAVDCFASRESAQGRLPVVSAKPKTIHVKHAARVHFVDGRFGLEQIPRGEWWEGMWRFPIGEGDPIGVVRHTVTRHRIALSVSISTQSAPAGLQWYSLEELKHLPMPSPQRRALKLAVEYLAQGQRLLDFERAETLLDGVDVGG
ncbi:MAG TPA: A/G-specific adenine glycosylase [Fimbriimonadaceae bacterium]|nr:A/G-specific adenine glycosylase [Fimbriimonadaceae bacterium]